MSDLIIDAVRVGHLISLAVGIGAAVFLESTVFARARNYVDTEELALLERGHHLITHALIGLWVTGLALVAIRTGFALENFTPKLITKLVIVTFLTINAVVIAKIAMPIMFDLQGGCLADLPQRDLLRLGAAAGFSGACWFSGLILGAVSAFKPMGAEPLMLIFGAMLLGGAAVGAGVAYLAGRAEPKQA